MKRVYLKDLKPDEVIRRLNAGEVVKDEQESYEKKLIDGIICTIYNDKGYVVNDYLVSDESAYFEEPEELKLEVGKCYRTRDGKKAFISSINNDSEFPFRGIIIGFDSTDKWLENGKFNVYQSENDLDLISEWNDDDVAKD